MEKTGTTSYNEIVVLGNKKIPHALFVYPKLCSLKKPYCPVPLLHVLDEIDRVVTSHDENSTFISATLPVNPFSDEGIRWLNAARESLYQLEEE